MVDRSAWNQDQLYISGTIDDDSRNTRSLFINSGSGNVTLGDSIGKAARFKALTVTGSNIYILADILTGTKQTYNGSIWIGDGSYIGKDFVEGFLFRSHSSYFKYGSGVSASSYDYKKNESGQPDSRYVRSLISEDPQITFNGTVDDVTTYTHTLLVAAIAQTSEPTGDAVPIIRFEQPVSFTQPLYSLNIQAVTPNPTDTCLACHIVMTGGASTYGSQTYRAGYVEATATTSGGDVTFSVYDPNASVNFLLPNNAQGQIDLRNPNSTDGLIIKGNTNFLIAPNLTGHQNWGRGVQFQDALGAMPNNNDQLTHYAQMQLYKKVLDGDSEVDLEASVEVDAIEQAPDCYIDQNDPLKIDPECKLMPVT